VSTPEQNPEWRTEADLANDERCWEPLGNPHERALPPRRLERSVQELRRDSRQRLEDWELLYYQLTAGR
jgi:hypothetical protein